MPTSIQQKMENLEIFRFSFFNISRDFKNHAMHLIRVRFEIGRTIIYREIGFKLSRI